MLDDDRLVLFGELHIRGVAKQLRVEMTVQRIGEDIRTRGDLLINHTDFGMKPYSALLGALKNRNQMKLVFDVLARPRDE